MQFLGRLSPGFRNHWRISAKITKIGRYPWKRKCEEVYFFDKFGLQSVVLLKFVLFTGAFQGFFSTTSAGYFKELLFLRSLFPRISLTGYFGSFWTKELYLRISKYLQLQSLYRTLLLEGYFSNLDPTLKNLDVEKPAPWKAWTLKNVENSWM